MPSAIPTTKENALTSHHKNIPESQIFGWSCFIEPYKMKLSAYCTSRRCKVLKINAQQLNKLMEKDMVIGFKIMRYIVHVLGYLFAQIKEDLARVKGINMMNSW
jgi:tmRNA-binding protein